MHPKTITTDILLVDDNELVLFLAQQRVRGSGLVLKTCMSAQEACEFLASQSVSLVLIDLRLPLVNGDELLEQLVAMDQLQGARTYICTSARPHDDVCLKIERLGAQILLKEAILEKNGILKLFAAKTDAA